MRTIGLLLFHRNWSLVLARVDLFRRMNPEVRLCALFGGEPEETDDARRAVEPCVDGFVSVGPRPPRWKWQNTDLLVREWFQRAGHAIPFDRVVVLQWDLLLFSSLERIYARVPSAAVGLTGLTRLDEVADRWHWMRAPAERASWDQLLAQVRRDRHYSTDPFACQGPGYCLPRRFLAEYSADDVPELGHDETRLPLFAQIYGHPLADTGFYPRWFDPTSEREFNATSEEIEVSVVRDELKRANGRRVFHPCRDAFDEATLQELLSTPGFAGLSP